VKRYLPVAIVVLILAVGLLIVVQFGFLSRWIGIGRPGDSAGKDGPEGGGRNVVALGRIEPAGGVLDISGTVSDRIDALRVTEGSEVEKDKTLAVLGSRTLREIELRSIESQLTEARARRTAEENLAVARIKTAELAVDKANALGADVAAAVKQGDLAVANLELAEDDLARFKDLPEDLVSQQKRQRQALLVQQAAAEMAAAEATLQKLNSTIKYSRGAAAAELAAAKAGKEQVLAAVPVESLEAARDLAREKLNRSIVVAPQRGTVLKIFTRPGETIARKPILQMADLDRMIVVAEVYETDISRIHLGQEAVITSKAFALPKDGDGLRGSVFRIGRMISTPELKSLDPFAQADRRVMEVLVEIDPEHTDLAGRFVNLQVDVTFLAKGESP